MPRLPKDPELRQRRNKAPTAAELPAPGSEELQRVKRPPLNAELLGIKGKVKPQVQRWWAEVWRSPMAPRWLATDIEVLYLCALIRQQIVAFAAEGRSVATLAAELRQQENRVGLDVMSRRRLDWRIAGPREAHEQPAARQEEPLSPPRIEEMMDPRRVLRAVK